MLNLFGYTRDPDVRIVRFELERAVQQELTVYLHEQIAQFNAGIEDEIVFDGKYRPDPGEILIVNPFVDMDQLSAAIAMPINFPTATPQDFSFDNLKALFTGEVNAAGSIDIYIQHFDRRRIISPTGFSLFHSQNVYKKIDGDGLTLDNKITAKLSAEKLSFQSFFLVRQIFDMTPYYYEATDTDIRAFAALPQIVQPDIDHLLAVSDTWVRRKLGLIVRSGILQNIPILDIQTIALDFDIDINCTVVDGVNKINLPTDKAELKDLLRFLDEDYYTSPLSKTNFLTNSKRAV